MDDRLSPQGWSRDDIAKLHYAIREEVARQIARILQDPATLARLLLFRLENPNLPDEIEIEDD